MAKVLRLGKTPFWGTVASGMGAQGILLDSVNYSTEVKDYEQQNELGAIKGYLVYDQTVSFDVSGTMLWDGGANLSCTSETTGLSETWSNPFKIGNYDPGSSSATLNEILSYATGWEMTNSKITSPTTPVIKTNSISTSAGGAATFSASGTIYDFT